MQHSIISPTRHWVAGWTFSTLESGIRRKLEELEENQLWNPGFASHRLI